MTMRMPQCLRGQGMGVSQASIYAYAVYFSSRLNENDHRSAPMTLDTLHSVRIPAEVHLAT